MCVRPRQDTLSSTLLCKTPNPEAQTTSACFELYQRARCLRLAFQCSGAPTTFGFQVSGSLNLDWIFGAWGSGQCDVGECIQALGSRAPTPPPHGIPPPLPAPSPRAPEPPLLPAVPHNRNEPTQTRGRGRWRMNRIRAGTGAPFARRREQHHILYGNEHVTMTLLLTSGGIPYHISVEHTAPHRRGGANQNDHRPHPTGGGGDKARNDDITTNKRQQPYHTSVEHTAPPQAGRGQPKRPQAPLHRGGWGEEGTRPNKTRRGKQQGQTRQLPT